LLREDPEQHEQDREATQPTCAPRNALLHAERDSHTRAHFRYQARPSPAGKLQSFHGLTGR
jgi:hypothetical protein